MRSVMRPEMRRQMAVAITPGCDRARGLGIPSSRKGTVLIIFLVCLLLLSLTVGILVRATLLHRNHLRTTLPQLQTEWIAHSAAELAAARLQSDSDWKGDTWTIAPDELGTGDAASVSVSATTVPDIPNRRSIEITVDYPPDSPERVRVQHNLLVDIPSS